MDYTLDPMMYSEPAQDIPVRESRPYDIVVFGATGFTGNIICKYLVKTYGLNKSVKWAIAGRSLQKLAEVKASLVLQDPDMSGLQLIQADSKSGEALSALCRSTRVVISTVGPYATYGTLLVNVAAALGTHYVDITGETDWATYCQKQFTPLARQTGAVIVHHCGHDSVPYDLVVMKMAQELSQRHLESLSEVQIFLEAHGGFSGGTITSLYNFFKRSKYRLQNQVAQQSGVKALRPQKTVYDGPFFLRYSCLFKQWVAFSVMAPCNVHVVRRSNSALSYSAPGTTLKYWEAALSHNFFMNAFIYCTIVMIAFLLALPPTAWLLMKYVMPQQGEGPDQKTMDEGYFHVFAQGKGSNGSTVHCAMGMQEDPGYKGTARMLTESGLSLALGNLKCAPGFHTPASALGDTLHTRLNNTGSFFSFYDPNKKQD